MQNPNLNRQCPQTHFSSNFWMNFNTSSWKCLFQHYFSVFFCHTFNREACEKARAYKYEYLTRKKKARLILLLIANLCILALKSSFVIFVLTKHFFWSLNNVFTIRLLKHSVDGFSPSISFLDASIVSVCSRLVSPITSPLSEISLYVFSEGSFAFFV